LNARHQLTMGIEGSEKLTKGRIQIVAKLRRGPVKEGTPSSWRDLKGENSPLVPSWDISRKKRAKQGNSPPWPESLGGHLRTRRPASERRSHRGNRDGSQGKDQGERKRRSALPESVCKPLDFKPGKQEGGRYGGAFISSRRGEKRKEEPNLKKKKNINQEDNKTGG